LRCPLQPQEKNIRVIFPAQRADMVSKAQDHTPARRQISIRKSHAACLQVVVSRQSKPSAAETSNPPSPMRQQNKTSLIDVCHHLFFILPEPPRVVTTCGVAAK
jgi:hypothetical protein